MPRVVTKQKGNRFEKVDYHIPYYTTAFFNPGSEQKDEGEEKKISHTVKLPIKIAADGDDSRANVTNFEMQGISYFDNNVEAVLESLSQLQERVIKPKGIEDPNEEWKVTLQLLQIICHSGPASQTLQEAARVGRTHVYETYFEGDDDVEEDILTNDEGAFYEFLDGGFQANDIPNDIDGVNNSDDFVEHLYQEHKRAFWNHLHSIIFGADAYRAYKQQKDYLLHKIVKPFGVPVEAAFRRIEVITRYMEYFPPSCSRGKQPSQEQWERHEETKKIETTLKKEMKYNLLPDSFQEKFDKRETDWTEMSSSKFLSEAQNFEAIEIKERQKGEKKKESLKRKSNKEDDSVSTLNRSQKDKNASSKKRKQNNETTNAGRQRLCELCKAAGTPEWVYTNHYTNQCKKKEEYARKLSGGVASRASATKDLRSKEDYRRREAKLINKIKTLKKRVKKSKKDDDSSISSMSVDDNVSY